MILLKSVLLLCTAYYFFNIADKQFTIHRKSYLGRVTWKGRKKYFNATRDIFFWLFTSENQNEQDFVYLGNVSSVFDSHFNPNKSTKVLIHGWKNSGNSTFCRIVKHAYVVHLDVNVIVVDWRRLSLSHYRTAYKHMHLVGKTVAKFLDFLWTLVPRESVHVIGHSLGAHVAGISGHYVRSGKIHRITGLDPAGPMMRKQPRKHKLDKNDAEFVDVIHTCGHYLGFHEPLGHADFYPNRGRPIQPGCGLDLFSRCSHRRSYHLFMESIYTNSRFWGIKCASWDRYEQKKCGFQIERMGEHINRSAFGKFYLKTRNAPPFGLGDPLEETDNYFRSLTVQSKKEDALSRIKEILKEKLKELICPPITTEVFIL